jgi:hypothetical protein
MNRNVMLVGVLALALLLGLMIGRVLAQDSGPQSTDSPQDALGTAFTYQGRLTDDGGPVSDDCDFEFSLWDEGGSGEPPAGGTLLGTDTAEGVQVRDGLFTVSLDFGAAAFNGQARWLQIAVDCGAGATTLSPRQRLTAAPYALYAANGPFWSLAGNAGTNPASQFLGTTDAVSLTLAVSGTAAQRLEPAVDD